MLSDGNPEKHLTITLLRLQTSIILTKFFFFLLQLCCKIQC